MSAPEPNIVVKPSQVVFLDQTSDEDSGRGSSVDPESAIISKYKEGSILWAEAQEGHFYPCLVGPDPDGCTLKYISGMISFLVHVNYFAGKSSWVPTSKLFPFVTLEEFEKTHKIDKACITKELFARSLALANQFVTIPIDQRLVRYQDDIMKNKFHTTKAEVVTPKLDKASKSMSRSIGVEKSKKISATREINAVKTEKELEDYLRKEYLTEDFHYSLMYPEHPMKKEYVCRLCYRPKNLSKCRGCNGQFHNQCVTKIKQGQPLPILSRFTIGTKTNGKKVKNSREEKEENNNNDTENIRKADTDLICFECESNTNKCSTNCQIKGEMEEMIECSQKGCFRHYHITCLKSFPQASVSDDGHIICPYHKCHTCFATTGNDSTELESKLVMCVLCPTSYHYNSVHCIPAGTEWLTTSQIICQNHAFRPPSNANVNWCFVCARGGDLLCCETCPGAFHLACINKTEIPEGKYTCEYCLAGYRPLYNQVVWAKSGQYRFWPAIILPPQVVPLSIIDDFHYPSDFCVKFFGTRDYAWVGRGLVFFLFDEDDFQQKNKGSHTNLEIAYNEALEEAKVAYKILIDKHSKSEQKRKHLKPDKYVKIRTTTAVSPLSLEKDVDENQECDEIHV